MLDWLLRDFSRQYPSVISPEKDKQGLYELNLGTKHPIILRDLEPGVYFFSRLCSPPVKNTEQFYLYLMKANFLGQGTGGAVLGLERDQKFLTLSLTLPYEVNYPMFRENLEDFLNYSEYWRTEAENYKKS